MVFVHSSIKVAVNSAPVEPSVVTTVEEATLDTELTDTL